MSTLRLSPLAKRDMQIFLDNVQRLPAHERDEFAFSFYEANEASWKRFVKGAYNHPVTWWIGIMQLQMQLGLWGHHYQSLASSRASLLWQLSEPLRSEAADTRNGEETPLLSFVVQYNLRHRKADIAGRFAGGKFTNYASMGGRWGSRRLPFSAKLSGAVTNWGIASYGAGIKAIAKGYRSIEAVIQSVLTGRPEELPSDYAACGYPPLNDKEQEVVEELYALFFEVVNLTQLSPGPVPLAEFCSRPENANLQGVCK